MIRNHLPDQYLQIFWVAVALAGIAFLLLAINRKTRPALSYPIVLTLVSAGPYLMFLSGTSMSQRQLTTVYKALFAAPLIFLLTAAVVASICYFRPAKAVSLDFTQEPGRPGFFWGVSFVFPFAVLLAAIPYVGNSDWLHMVPPFREWIVSYGHTIRFLLLTIVVNYLVVALLAAAFLYSFGFFRRINPATYGKGILVLTNALELIRALVVAYFIYAWRNESFFMRVSEIDQLFVWPLRCAAIIGLGTIVLSNVLKAGPNRSLQPGTLARAAH